MFCKRYFSKARSTVFLMLAIILFGGIIANIVPFFWGKIIDYLTLGNIQGLVACFLLYFVSTYLTYGLGILEGYIGAKLNYVFESQIKTDILNHILHMQCKDLDEFDTGTLISRVNSDSSTVVTFAFDVTTSIVIIAINIVSALFFAFRTSVRLSLASIAFIPLSVFVNMAFKKPFRLLSEDQKKYGDRMSSFSVGTLGHVIDSKAFCLEGERVRKYIELIREGWALQKRGLVLSNKSSIISSLITSASTFVMLFLSAVLIRQGSFTVGGMVTFQAYIDKLTSSISKLLQMNYSAQTAEVAIDRIQEVLSKDQEVTAEKEMSMVVSQIALDNVSFSYRSGVPVLNNICFCIDRPGLYAIVGENGCGKSTVLKLLLQYYQANQGAICINEIDISKIPSSVIRQNIGFYAKDVYIQDDTLLSNLLLGTGISADSNVPPEVLDACKRVGLDAFIDQLPEKYHTVVGENGKLLSSGQMQRIAVVRAMLSSYSVLLFDEITSDLDGYAEKEIIDILHEIAREKIIIHVTHRIRSAEGATQVFFMKQGKIEAVGTHESLMSVSKEYKDMFKQQL